MKCPTCEGEGWVLGTGYTSGHGCDGTDEVCAQVCPVPEPIQIQELCFDCRGTGSVLLPTTPAVKE